MPTSFPTRPSPYLREVVHSIGDAFVNKPENFTVHTKLQQLLDKRLDMSRSGNIDWGFGELLAFGSLLLEGPPVRLAGKDFCLGTLVKRASVLPDPETELELAWGRYRVCKNGKI